VAFDGVRRSFTSSVIQSRIRGGLAAIKVVFCDTRRMAAEGFGR
jgi:hypothetical protein